MVTHTFVVPRFEDRIALSASVADTEFTVVQTSRMQKYATQYGRGFDRVRILSKTNAKVVVHRDGDKNDAYVMAEGADALLDGKEFRSILIQNISGATATIELDLFVEADGGKR